MRPEAWLERARDHLFVAGVGDLGTQLCAANMTYGLAKLHFALDQLGRPADAMFLAAPDATITRNAYRWTQGFGYGGLLRWSAQVAVLDGKPNGCGMVVGGLDEAPDERRVHEAAAAARGDLPPLDGVELQYDLDQGNHFADACELVEVLAPDAPTLPPHLCVVHSSGHEHRSASPYGPGLYIDESEELARMATRCRTPWGSVALLLDDDARRYATFCERVQRFNQERRRLLASRLFGGLEVLCNATHQGLREPGAFYLGAYWFDREDQLFPLTLGPDQPLYLVRPRRNFTPETIEQLGWSARAETAGLLETLARADILPHGGGYRLEGRLVGIDDHGDHRTFRVRDRSATREVADIRDLPYGYRGDEVLRRLAELQLAEPVARYRVRFVVR